MEPEENQNEWPDRFRRLGIFLFGTPRRAWYSAVTIFVILILVIPGLLGLIVERLLDAFAPLLPVLVILMIVGVAFRKIFSGFFKKPSKK